MDQNRLSLLALHFIPGLGDYNIRQLISYCGSAEKIFKTPRGKLLKVPGIGAVTAAEILKSEPFKTAEKEVILAEKQGVKLVFFTDKAYPTRLKNVDDAPTLLYCKGNIDFENEKTVGIVGTRKATEYGRDRVEELIAGLAGHRALIVSGLAYGIDILAHKEAVNCGLPTLGVMGSGIDVIYPSSHRETVKKMLGRGGIVTENRFGTNPDAHNFPARNRIISGLSDALVVVEAAERGGALITAEISNSYNKDVFAFPGDVGRSYSEGCNNLIKSNKACMITSVKDLEYAMNWAVGQHVLKKKLEIDLDQFSTDEQMVVKTLLENKNQLTLDELSWRTSFSVSQLATLLLTLEFRGSITSLPGKVFRLKV